MFMLLAVSDTSSTTSWVAFAGSLTVGVFGLVGAIYSANRGAVGRWKRDADPESAMSLRVGRIETDNSTRAEATAGFRGNHDLATNAWVGEINVLIRDIQRTLAGLQVNLRRFHPEVDTEEASDNR